MNYEDDTIQDLESNIELWLLQDESDLINNFGENFAYAVAEELRDE